MVKTKDEYPVIESYIREIIKAFGKAIWVNDNFCEIRKGEKVLGKITLKDNEMESSGKEIEALHKELIKRKEDAEKNKLTPGKVKESALRNIFDHPESYNGLKENPVVFFALDKALKKFDIEEVIVSKQINGGNSVKKKLTFAIDCSPDNNALDNPESGYYSRLKNIIYDNYFTDIKRKENFNITSSKG
ncbi:unnamed protein product, partial [marine sediment metagenome]